MIGMFKGAVSTTEGRNNTGFVALAHELRAYLKDFSGSEWLVLTALALHADENGHSCPSVASLSAVTGLSGRSVQEAIKSLSTANLRGYCVLRSEKRVDRSGRCTSNGYAILPDGFPKREGAESAEAPADFAGAPAKNDRVDPANSAGSLTLKYIHKEVDTPPIVPPKGRTKRDSIKLPGDADPARALFVAYRSEAFGQGSANEFTIGEWRAAHHVLRAMQAAKVTPDQVARGTRKLMQSWGNPSMVTVNALWKHWTASQVTSDPLAATRAVVDKAGEMFDSFVGFDKSVLPS